MCRGVSENGTDFVVQQKDQRSPIPSWGHIEKSTK